MGSFTTFCQLNDLDIWTQAHSFVVGEAVAEVAPIYHDDLHTHIVPQNGRCLNAANVNNKIQRIETVRISILQPIDGSSSVDYLFELMLSHPEDGSSIIGL